MSPAGLLARDFFARGTETVARELLGCTVVADAGAPTEVHAIIVEVEAYLGTADEASHAARGPTARSRIMFGPPGHLYVYLSYGMHHCANVVTEVDGTAGAVLLRAASVTEGEAVVRRRRSGPHLAAESLLRGPGNLCRGLGLGRADNGLDLCDPSSRVLVAGATDGHVPQEIVAGPRVGISRAADHPLRFVWSGHPAVSGRTGAR